MKTNAVQIEIEKGKEEKKKERKVNMSNARKREKKTPRTGYTHT